MAEFFWRESVDQGCCICGSPGDTRGFVDLIGEINVKRGDYEIAGVVDLYVCASCMEQAAKVVGCATRKEVEDFAYREHELMTQLEHTKDEVVSERQKHEHFINSLYELKEEEPREVYHDLVE